MNPVVARVREEFMQKVLAALEAGEKPVWQRPWDASSDVPFNPVSRINDKRASYHGGNLIRLLITGVVSGYDDPRWVTYKQAQSMRAGSMERLTPEELAWNAALPSRDGRRVPTWQVREGEKGTPIEFWSPAKGKAAAVDDDEDDSRRVASRWFGRVYSVFNGSQIDNMPALVTPRIAVEPTTVENLVSERLRQAMGVKLSPAKADRAYYTPAYDEITMPAVAAFHSLEAYDETLLHEVFHAAGHESRLDRKSEGRFGSPEYAKEELAAQLSVFFFAVENRLNLTGVEAESHNYLLSWVTMFKEEGAKVLFAAASQADRAVRYAAELLPDLAQRLEHEDVAVAAPREEKRAVPPLPTRPLSVVLPPSAGLENGAFDGLPDEDPVDSLIPVAPATPPEAHAPATPPWAGVPQPMAVDPALLPPVSSLKRVL